tara:strand:+ start:512 stop:661 length:150 start_codon:yes stop_codon:yes gene_type:complete
MERNQGVGHNQLNFLSRVYRGIGQALGRSFGFAQDGKELNLIFVYNEDA